MESGVDQKPLAGIARTVLDLIKNNWLSLLLLGGLAWFLVTDRYPAWQRGQRLVGQAAPDFVLQNLAGQAVRLSDYRGKKVLLNFWATWCLPCRVEMPHLTALQKDLAGKDFALLTITAENPAHVKVFAERHGIEYPVLLDPREDSLLRYGVEEYPTLVWIDETGRIGSVSTGLNLLLRWTVRFKVSGNPF